jgi:gliding motility-associated-like protein
VHFFLWTVSNGVFYCFYLLYKVFNTLPIQTILNGRYLSAIDAIRPNLLRIKDTVTLTSKGGGSYLWLHSFSTNSVLNYKSIQAEEVVYTVRVTDTNNCWDIVSYKIVTEFDTECHYGIPNIFTPNNDDLNDIFIPSLSDCADIQLFAVYNRWGEKMFETNENKGWDGYYKNKLAPAGI